MGTEPGSHFVTGIDIDGFRCFEHIAIRGLTQVNLFVGKNNSGKTTVLEAIEAFVTNGVSVGRALQSRGAVRPQPNDQFRVVGHHKGGAAKQLSVPPSALFDYSVHGNPGVAFLPTERIGQQKLASMWNRISLTSAEDKTIELLRLLDPRVTRAAVKDEEVQVVLSGNPTPLRLSSMGEGMTRMLAIGVEMSRAAGGSLFIDELESGLHWSVMSRLWRFIVEAARELNVQVFITTHSSDCIRAIAHLNHSDPDLAADITVHRLVAGKKESIPLDAGNIENGVEFDMEVR